MLKTLHMTKTEIRIVPKYIHDLKRFSDTETEFS